MSMSAFFTKDAANEGVTLPLTLPDGAESEYKLTILSVDSDSYRSMNLECNRRLRDSVQGLQDGSKERLEALSAAYEANRVSLLASVIKDWNFPEPCTRENKEKLLREAPQIAAVIDEFAGNRRAFFLAWRATCTNLQEANSD